MYDQSRVGAVCQLQYFGLVESPQDLVHSADRVAFQQGIDPAVGRIQQCFREDLAGDVAAAVRFGLPGGFLNEAAHRLSVVALVSLQDHAVSGSSDDAQMALLKPAAQGIHITAGRCLADAQHLTVVKEFARRPVTEQFEQQSPSSSVPVRRVRILLSPEAVLQLVQICLLPFEDYAFSFVVFQFEMIGFDAELQIIELSLYSSLADAQLIRDLLLSHGPAARQQDLQNLLNPGCKFHLPPQKRYIIQYLYLQ